MSIEYNYQYKTVEVMKPVEEEIETGVIISDGQTTVSIIDEKYDTDISDCTSILNDKFANNPHVRIINDDNRFGPDVVTWDWTPAELRSFALVLEHAASWIEENYGEKDES